jgi:hypothetical protein
MPMLDMVTELELAALAIFVLAAATLVVASVAPTRNEAARAKERVLSRALSMYWVDHERARPYGAPDSEIQWR